MARKIDAPGVVVPRLKQHRTALNKIVNDDRISGSRRLLAQFLAAWMDCYNNPVEQAQLLRIIEGTFGSPQRTRFVESDEGAITEPQDNLTKAASQEIKDIWNTALALKEQT